MKQLTFLKIIVWNMLKVKIFTFHFPFCFISKIFIPNYPTRTLLQWLVQRFSFYSSPGRKNSIRCHLILRASYFYIYYYIPPIFAKQFSFLSHSSAVVAIFLSSNRNWNEKKIDARKERKENYTGYCSIAIFNNTRVKIINGIL